MIKLPDAILKLIESFKELPGVGSKTAERLSYFILESNLSYIENWSDQTAPYCKVGLATRCQD